MAKRLEHLEVAIAECERNGVGYATEPSGGGHIRFLMTLAGQQRSIFLSRSPSDRLVTKNVQGDVRRAIRTLRELAGR
jgi:hypothetical protein